MNNCTSVPKDFPRCGACVYWSGQKEVHGDIVEYDMFSNGQCNNFDSPSYGKTLDADQYCFSKKDY